jgi:uncharacterized protein (TIGR02996 family)
MTPDDAFLQAIIETPDDDTPRLVYADWLEDQGQPERAEFIRVQIALATLPEADRLRRQELKARERQLLKQHEHGQDWTGSLWQLTEDYEFRRGFVEAIAIVADFFLQRAEVLFRAAPVREVRLCDPCEKIGKLAACPHLGRLRTLDLSGLLLDSVCARELLSSPHLGRLQKLGLSGLGLAAIDFVLPRPDLVPDLTALDLGSNHLGDEEVEHLVTTALCRRLRWLELANNGLTDAGVEALTSGRLAEVRSLGLSWNSVGVPGVRALARSPSWPRMENLDLSFNPVGDSGARELLAAPRPGELTTLSLVESTISEPLQQALREHFGPSVCRFS